MPNAYVRCKYAQANGCDAILTNVASNDIG